VSRGRDEAVRCRQRSDVAVIVRVAGAVMLRRSAASPSFSAFLLFSSASCLPLAAAAVEGENP